jgi:RNA polymerase sigma-70 factor (ECF subfamily)
LEAAVPEGIEVVDHVEAERVRVALARLPAEQRVALERAYYRCESQRAIALALGVPLGTIKSRLALGLRRLAGELGPQGSNR